MAFLGMYRHARTAHVQSITGETFISLGTNALSGKDICTEGGVIALAEGDLRNHSQLARAFRLPYHSRPSAIVMRAYKTWGVDYPSHIEGAVMTAVIDRAEDRMIVTRDRMGALPVYYSWRARSTAFASRAEFLLLAGAAGRMVNREGLCEILAMGGVYTPGRTPFRDIRMLEAGCMLLSDGRGVRVKRYYSLISAVEKKERSDYATFRESYISAAGEMSRKQPGILILGSPGDIALSGAIERKYRECPRGYALKDRITPEYRKEILNLNLSLEDLSTDGDELFDCMEENAHIMGFPGYKWEDALFMLAVKGASKHEKNLAASMDDGLYARGGIFPWAEGDNALTYVKRWVKEKLNADQYVNDRRHEMLDRLLFSGGADACDDQLVSNLQYALFALPAVSQKRWAIAHHMGVKLHSPMFDERVVVNLVCAGEDGCVERLAMEMSGAEMVNEKRLRIAQMPPEAFEKRVLEDALRIASDDNEPVSRLADADKIKKHVRGGCADIGALCSILQLNRFLIEFEAETEL